MNPTLWLAVTVRPGTDFHRSLPRSGPSSSQARQPQAPLGRPVTAQALPRPAQVWRPGPPQPGSDGRSRARISRRRKASAVRVQAAAPRSQCLPRSPGPGHGPERPSDPAPPNPPPAPLAFPLGLHILQPGPNLYRKNPGPGTGRPAPRSTDPAGLADLSPPNPRGPGPGQPAGRLPPARGAPATTAARRAGPSALPIGPRGTPAPLPPHRHVRGPCSELGRARPPPAPASRHEHSPRGDESPQGLCQQFNRTAPPPPPPFPPGLPLTSCDYLSSLPPSLPLSHLSPCFPLSLSTSRAHARSRCAQAHREPRRRRGPRPRKCPTADRADREADSDESSPGRPPGHRLPSEPAAKPGPSAPGRAPPPTALPGRDCHGSLSRALERGFAAGPFPGPGKAPPPTALSGSTLP